MDQRRAANPSKGSRPASAFAVYTAIATAFSSSQQSDQLSETPAAGCHRSNMLPYTGMPQCDEHVEEGSVRKELRSQPFVGASFQLAHAFDKMKSRRHKRRGCEFSHVGASFQLAHAFDKMKSRRHKRCGCKFSNLHFPDTMTRWKSCRHKRGKGRERQVSHLSLAQRAVARRDCLSSFDGWRSRLWIHCMLDRTMRLRVR